MTRNMLVAGLLTGMVMAVPALAQAQSSYRLTCDMTLKQTTRSPNGPTLDNETYYTQVYTVDPASRTVTRRFAYDNEAKDWVEDPQTFSDVRVVNDQQLAFCEDTVDECRKGVRQRGATTVETIKELVTIDLESGLIRSRQSIYGSNATTSLRSESRYSGSCQRR